MEFFAIIFTIAFYYILFLIFRRVYRWLKRPALDPEPPKPTKLPYQKKDFLLSNSERKFYYALEQVARGNNYHLFAKVRLEDLIEVPQSLSYGYRFGLRNRIKSRHIDFVLCDYKYIRPVLAIELDGSSHFRADRIESDDFLNKTLSDVGLPLLRFPVKSFYDQGEIANRIAITMKLK